MKKDLLIALLIFALALFALHGFTVKAQSTEPGGACQPPILPYNGPDLIVAACVDLLQQCPFYRAGPINQTVNFWCNVDGEWFSYVNLNVSPAYPLKAYLPNVIR